MHWHFASQVPGDARVQLAATMARFMAPLGVSVSGSAVGPLRPEVIACLQSVGLPGPAVELLDGRHVDVLVLIAEDNDELEPDAPVADERHVLKVERPKGQEQLLTTRERLREHLRRLMARRTGQPSDPEASPGWIRDVDRQG